MPAARKGPRYQNGYRAIGEVKRVECEQAIARGWSAARIAIELGIGQAEYELVLAAMEEACKT